MKVSRILKWILFVLEGFFGIPILGGAVILLTGWFPLTLLFVIHAISLVFSIIEKQHKTANIMGLITACIGWIPVLGMTLHIITAIILLVDVARKPKQA